MKLLVYDIETLLEMFLIVIYNPETNEYIEFEVSEEVNSLDAFIKYIEGHSDYYWVGFNCLRFDSQVVEWIYRHHNKWWDLSALEIASMISQKAQDVISDSNYDILPQYAEKDLFSPQMDLFLIWHFNNDSKRTSLKAVEFSIDFENIEEMPIHHLKRDLSSEERMDIRTYCKNDVNATYALYLITRGETTNPLYMGEDKIADRFAMKEEFGLDCLNFDDVKIGAEWNKLDYMKLTGKSERDLKPERVNRYFGKKFKTFFPNTVSYQTKPLQEFVKKIGETYAINKKQEFKYKFNEELTATIAKGGIHSCEGGRFLQPADDEIYYQIDIGSQYPNAIRKYKVEPKHLPGWNSLIVNKIARRLGYKALYKETKDHKYNSLQKMGKLSLNGGSYGRLNTKGDWQEDPCCMLQVTIGGQLEILMIVETLIMKGFRVVSLNTDGWDVIIPRSREKEFREILSDFEKKIGNDTLGNFEYTRFMWIAQTSVNDYIALKEDGELKMKGDFEVDKELHKNKSMRIIPIALREYFKNKIPVEDTIKAHTNIYDFCIRQKSTKDFHYEGINRSTGETTVYNKLIRYYVSGAGEKLYKIKNPECTTNAPKQSQVEAGEWVCNVCNYLPKDTDVKTANINYKYYIEKAEEIIRKVEGKKKVTIIPGQMSLF